MVPGAVKEAVDQVLSVQPAEQAKSRMIFIQAKPGNPLLCWEKVMENFELELDQLRPKTLGSS